MFRYCRHCKCVTQWKFSTRMNPQGHCQGCEQGAYLRHLHYRPPPATYLPTHQEQPAWRAEHEGKILRLIEVVAKGEPT